MPFPRFFLVRQSFARPRLASGTESDNAAIARTVADQLSACGFAEQLQPGQTVAITAGSRGIANNAAILRGAAAFVSQRGGKPFLVPAMGSHGGGTAQGQLSVLQNLGVTEQTVGCPIHSSMATGVLGHAVCGGPTDPPVPIHFDLAALAADHTLVVNRVKPHTHFLGPVQSGLIKMLVIGLGKHEGAKIAHRAAIDYGWERIAKAGAAVAIVNSNVRAGLAIIENGYDETARIVGLAADEILVREAELLRDAEALLPKLPFDAADLLIVDRMGKNISGAGMDTLVVGRKPGAKHLPPHVKRIWVRGLTEETHGNATGIGTADYCSQRVLDQIDHNVTRINCNTAGNPRAGMIPLCYPTERETAEAALATIGLSRADDAKAMWIRDTRHLEIVACSQPLLEAARDRDDLEILSQPAEMQFDAAGGLQSVFTANMSAS